MRRWKAVVFDLDDTLYPEREFVRGGMRAAAAWAQRTLATDADEAFGELWGSFEAGARGDTFNRWLAQRGAGTEANVAGMVSAYRHHRPDLSPYPDVLPVLEGLRGGHRLGLITEGVTSVQQAKIEALGLQDLLPEQVILGEDLRGEWKPSRRPFDRWLEGKGLRPGEVVYVGDNPAKDFLGARRGGWSSVRVRRPDGLHAAEEPAGPEAAPDFEMEDLTRLAALAAG